MLGKIFIIISFLNVVLHTLPCQTEIYKTLKNCKHSANKDKLDFLFVAFISINTFSEK